MELRSRIITHIKKYTFYKLLHDLERLGFHGPKRLSVRPVASQMFPARDIYGIHLENGAGGSEGKTVESSKAEVEAWFGGLYGVDSPLPMYFDDILNEDSAAGKNLGRLLMLVGNRFYHLLYEIWSRTAPMFCSEEALKDYVRKPVLSICGLGHLRRTRTNMLSAAAYLVQGLRNRWGLETMLTHFLHVPVEVREFEPSRVPLRDDEKTQLGNPRTSVLGRQFRATPYRETFATHVRIVCGPLETEQYLSLLPGGERYAVLVYLAFRYFPVDLEYHLELVLAAHSVKDMRFELRQGRSRLGATTVLGSGRIGRALSILREGVSPSSNPEELNNIIDLIECKDRPGTLN